MANSTVPTKTPGETLTANEINNIVNAVNSKADNVTLLAKPQTGLAVANIPGGLSLSWIDNNLSLGNNDTVVVIGSSTSAGNGASTYANAYVGRLTTWLQATYKNQVLTNLALAGSTTYNLMPTGYTAPSGRPAANTSRNITAALALNPKVIIMNIPTNDTNNGYTNTEYLSNILTIYNLAKIAGIKIYVSTTQPRNLTLNGRNALKQLTVATNALIDADDLLDFYTPTADANGFIKSDLDSGDGIHLNDAGHQILFDTVKSKLQPYIESTIIVTSQQVELYDISATQWVVAGTVNKLATSFDILNLSPNETCVARVKTLSALNVATSQPLLFTYMAPPVVTVTPATTTVSSGQTVALAASADITGSTFYWYTVATGGTPVATGANYTTQALTTSVTYYVEAVSPNNVASTNRASVAITVTNPAPNPAPVVSVNPPSTSIASGQTTTFNASADIVGSTFKWYTQQVGGTPIFTGDNFTTPALTTAITYYVEATSPANVTSASRASANVSISTPFGIGPLDSYFSAANITNPVQKQIAMDLYNAINQAGYLSKIININLPLGTNSSAIGYNILNPNQYKWIFFGDSPSAYSPQGWKFASGRYALHDGILTDSNIVNGFGAVMYNSTAETVDGGSHVIYGGFQNPGYVISIARSIQGNCRIRCGANNNAAIADPSNQYKLGFMGAKPSLDYSVSEVWIDTTKAGTANTAYTAPGTGINYNPSIGQYHENNNFNYTSYATIAMLVNFHGLTDNEYIDLIGRLRTAAIALGLNGASIT
ncbi:GDSL-type esterase/lipase family protein [Mucilaginibacter lacusdianchii]|uniref:Ig-like domain-containing protein n=1 Tax=Mucilaginibacter lacusdianchii TaxID=2684211 RepID=UPI00131C047D|nr:GDSL-type esterase/lipase family protein [Mucilaginibacter sp. JXJ CY 39]